MREKLLQEKDTKRSLWWVEDGQPGSSMEKIRKWIELADHKYRRGAAEEEVEALEPAMDRHSSSGSDLPDSLMAAPPRKRR